MALSDPRGIAVTAASPAAVEALEATIVAYCEFRRDTGERLKAALAADPNLVIGHILRGYFMLLLVKRELIARAQQAAEAADAAIEAVGATPRERRHRAALGAWIRRDQPAAIATLQAILAEHPRDLLALKLVQYLVFYSGASLAMRDTVARALPGWGDGVPGYGFVLGCHAFGLEECGEYDAAAAAGRRGAALEPGDIWGGHAVTHVFEMTDRTADGLAWVAERAPDWTQANNFAFHVSWHRCLFLLEQERYDEALGCYDRDVRAESTDEYLDITNAVSLLWRMEQRGLAVGSRWHELAQRSAARLGDHMMAFGDAHYAMALAAAPVEQPPPNKSAAAGGADDFPRWRESAGSFAARSRESQAAVMTEIGLALGDAALAHRRGEWGRAVDLLWPVRHRIHRIGGSHAQRDLFAQLLIDAALKSGRMEIARELLIERLAARPNNAWARAALRLAG